jgi:hypothetical protein
MLEGVDGRSASARRFRDICRSYELEAGGVVTGVERDMIRQAAALTLRAEQLQADIVNGRPVDVDRLTRISGATKRILGAIHVKSTKRKDGEPVADLAAYLANKAAGGAP